MKKSNLIKALLVLILATVVVGMATMVNAADNTNGFSDISGTLTGNSSNNARNNAGLGNTNNTNTNSLNTNKSNTNSNTNTNNTNKTNNTSLYNNTNLPKTGIASSLPAAALVVVFGISAVFAYKKISDYRNI